MGLRMKILNIKELEPGMVVAEDVVTKSGQVITPKGTKLDSKLIVRFDFYSIYRVKIVENEEDTTPITAKEALEALEKERLEEEAVKIAEAERRAKLEELERKKKDILEEQRLEEERKAKEAEALAAAAEAAKAKLAAASSENKADIHTEDYLNAGRASYSQKIQRSDSFRHFQSDYAMNISELKDYLNNYIKTKKLDSTELINMSLKPLREQKYTTQGLFDMLHNVRSVNDSVYAHSLNVAYIARMLGQWLKLDADTIRDLTLAGLLHDIGKCKVPGSILYKPDKLTPSEYEAVKLHTVYGYELLRDADIPNRVLRAVLNHHERRDGSGYPNCISGNSVDEFTMIIAVADVYDAMTAARSYRAPMCPFTVIEAFEKEGLNKYPTKIILTFLERIANTYHHNRVRLNDGTIGTIMLINNSQLCKRVIQLDNGEFLDLSRASGLHIAGILLCETDL